MCSITVPASVTLPADTRAPGIARKFVRDSMCEHHDASVLVGAQLLVSELVTNAVRHGAPPITARVACDGSASMTVHVTDNSTDEPRLVAFDTAAESGRGVALVDIVSDGWGVDHIDGDGKTVWFRLRP